MKLNPQLFYNEMINMENRASANGCWVTGDDASTHEFVLYFVFHKIMCDATVTVNTDSTSCCL